MIIPKWRAEAARAAASRFVHATTEMNREET